MTAANRERHQYVWLDDIRPATLTPKRFLGTSQTAAEHAKHCQTIIDTTARTATSARHSSRWPRPGGGLRIRQNAVSGVLRRGREIAGHSPSAAGSASGQGRPISARALASAWRSDESL